VLLDQQPLGHCEGRNCQRESLGGMFTCRPGVGTGFADVFADVFAATAIVVVVNARDACGKRHQQQTHGRKTIKRQRPANETFRRAHGKSWIRGGTTLQQHAQHVVCRADNTCRA